MGRLKLLLRIGQLLRRHLKITLCRRLPLFCCCLSGFLVLHVFGVCTRLILKGLLQHLKVMFSVHLCLAEVTELALGLFFEVLQHIQNIAAMGFVTCCRWAAQLVISICTLRLYECRQLLLVAAGEGRRIEHGTEGLQSTSNIRTVKLSKGSWVFLPFLSPIPQQLGSTDQWPPSTP